MKTLLNKCLQFCISIFSKLIPSWVSAVKIPLQKHCEKTSFNFFFFVTGIAFVLFSNYQLVLSCSGLFRYMNDVSVRDANYTLGAANRQSIENSNITSIPQIQNFVTSVPCNEVVLKKMGQPDDGEIMQKSRLTEDLYQQKYKQCESFSEYIFWHSSMMKRLRSTSLHQNVPVLIWRCPGGMNSKCHGMGDRLRGILSALTLAMMTNRVFLLQWPNSQLELLHVAQPSAIDWRIPKELNISVLPIIKDIGRGEYVLNYNHYPDQPAFSSQNSSLPRNTSSVSLQQLLIHDNRVAQIINESSGIIVDSLATSSKYILRSKEWTEKFSDFNTKMFSTLLLNRLLMRAVFKPSSTVENIIQPIQFRKDSRRRQYISVHIRTGEDIGEKTLDRFYSHDDLQSILPALVFSCIRNITSRLPASLFVASDSAAMKNSFIKSSKAEGFEVLYSNISAFHIAQDGVATNSSDSSDCQSYSSPNLRRKMLGTIGIFVDFFALAGGMFFITTNSEFSRLAFIYSSAESMKTLPLNNRKYGKCNRYISFG